MSTPVGILERAALDVEPMVERAGRRVEVERLVVDPRGPVRGGGFTSNGDAAATRRLLAGPEAPTAIVYANDLMAVGGLAAARELGRRGA